MNKKILLSATVDTHILAFHLPYLKYFKEQGYETHVMANGNNIIPYCDKRHQINISRSPFKLNNIKAYQGIKQVINKEHFDIIHCHTPMGGVLTRLAARETRKKGTKVIYTAHGFHFYKGAPLLNWLIYYPIEKILAQYTDCLITINSEDYNLAKVKKIKAKTIEHVNGVGVDLNKFKPITQEQKSVLKHRFGYETNVPILMYVAELNKNKNQQLLIRIMPEIVRQFPKVKLLLIGRDSYNEVYQKLAMALGVEENIDFLGARDDIDNILPICDIYLASSLREGLPVNVMEAMALGLPVVANSNRGHQELIQDNQNGYLLVNQDLAGFSNIIIGLLKDKDLRNKLGDSALKSIEKYDIVKVLEQMRCIYRLYR